MDASTNSQRPKLEDVLDSSHVSTFLSSQPLVGQEWCVISYAVSAKKDGTPNVQDGIYSIVKVLGTYPSEKKAKRRAKQELDNGGVIRVMKVHKTGAWVYVKDPTSLSADQVTKHSKDARVKELIALQAARLKQKEEDEKKEMEVYMKEMQRQEKALDDPNTVEHYAMLHVRARSIPGLKEGMKKEVERLLTEVVRLNDILPKLQEEIRTLDVRHPEYSSKLEDTIKLLAERHAE